MCVVSQTGSDKFADIVKMYNEGMSYAAISDRVGKSYYAVHSALRKLREAGVIERRLVRERGAKRGPRFVSTPELDSQIIAMYEEGMSYQEIAMSCGVALSNLKRIFERLVRVGALHRRKSLILSGEQSTKKLDYDARMCLRRKFAQATPRRAWEAEPDWAREQAEKARKFTV